MPKAKGQTKTTNKSAVVDGRKIQFINATTGHNAQLLIDGVKQSYVEGSNGFTLMRAAYEPPAPTLYEAGERFVKARTKAYASQPVGSQQRGAD